MRWVGWWRYGGEPTCGHCKYWEPGWKKENEKYWSDFFSAYLLKKVWVRTKKGDCKLLYGTEDTTDKDTCDRFKPRFRYKHWVRL